MENTEKTKWVLDESHFMRDKLHGSNSALDKYCALVLGYRSIPKLIKQELITLLFGHIPGALGLALRQVFYPMLFKNIGSNVVFGRAMTIRCPDNFIIGDNVIFDDYSILDGRGAINEPIEIHDHVVINRGAFIHSKLGSIRIGKYSTIGAGTGLVAQGNGVFIGDWVSIAGGCEMSCALFEQKEVTAEDPTPFTRYTMGPIVVGDRSIVAFGAIILDGVSIGEDCMVGAGCIVMDNLPANSTIASRPGIMIRKKKDD